MRRPNSISTNKIRPVSGEIIRQSEPGNLKAEHSMIITLEFERQLESPGTVELVTQSLLKSGWKVQLSDDHLVVAQLKQKLPKSYTTLTAMISWRTIKESVETVAIKIEGREENPESKTSEEIQALNSRSSMNLLECILKTCGN